MTDHKGVVWWQGLGSYQKMAVIRHCLDRKMKIAEIKNTLQLESQNTVVGVKSRLQERIRLGETIPPATNPEDVGTLVEPEDWIKVRKGVGKRRYTKKARPERDGNSPTPEPGMTNEIDEERVEPTYRIPKPRRFVQFKKMKCCDSGCDENAVPGLAFCKAHSLLRYNPLTQQIKALIEAA
jgi:hypothetical protein